MDRATVTLYEQSLRRCTAQPEFLTRFYANFMASSAEVRAKFALTDFEKQKREIRASLFLMSLAAQDESAGPERHLREIAVMHGKHHLDIGARLYDLWLDSLVTTVREFDPQFTPEIGKAWEAVMTIGIAYMVSRYGDGATAGL